eukprot:339415-Prymnesium_polylepis.1
MTSKLDQRVTTALACNGISTEGTFQDRMDRIVGVSSRPVRKRGRPSATSKDVDATTKELSEVYVAIAAANLTKKLNSKKLRKLAIELNMDDTIQESELGDAIARELERQEVKEALGTR